MWNRQDIVDFKGIIRKEGPDGIIKVGHGETVTVSWVFSSFCSHFISIYLVLHLLKER